MRIIVFGASGRTGIPFVDQALAAGHEILGFVRSRDKLPPELLGRPVRQMQVIEGDVLRPADVHRAFEGKRADAVVSVLGPTKSSPDDLLPAAARAIVSAMKESGVSRLVWMTGAGVPADGDEPKLGDHLIRSALRVFAPKALAQSQAAAHIIRTSRLEWTIVRVPMLQDGEGVGSYRVGRVGVGTGPRLIRADGAAFLLREVESPQHVHGLPVVSN
jgi:putative NADH-flavin reductase